MRKILNGEQENWLYVNYPDKTNEELAKELTAIVKKENIKQADRLKALLDGITDPATEKAARSKIASLLMFEGVNAEFVRKQALRLKCPPKTLALRSESARKKAMKTNIKIWLSKAVRVNAPMDWFRSFMVNESKVCVVKDAREMKSIRTAMSRWNREEGFFKGIFLSSVYVEEAKLLRVKANINKVSGTL